MTRVRLAAGVIEDLDRIVSHLRRYEIENAAARADEIISVLDVLADNPLSAARRATTSANWSLAGLHGDTSRFIDTCH